MKRCIAFSMLTVVAACVAHAEDVTATRAWIGCQGGEGIWGEMRISGCNEVIKSGRVEGENLALVHYFRGNAWLQKAEYRKAIDDYSTALKLKADDANALHERCWARATSARCHGCSRSGTTGACPPASRSSRRCRASGTRPPAW